MAWWWHKKLVFPVKRAWLAVAARVRSRKDGSGILKLHDDVQSCGYQDVQMMWEMLRSGGIEPSRISRQRKRPSRRPHGWSGHCLPPPSNPEASEPHIIVIKQGFQPPTCSRI